MEVRLTSMNELYKDILMSGDELEMLKIVGIVRKVIPLGVGGSRSNTILTAL
ncbi:MAG: hypothetical protein LUC34_00845 [Campylobacter sp.]|nr:hypothetical protein [Campylobacter sp.]